MANETYRLKPGNHQFIPGDIPHNNDNTTSDQIAWYLQQYPHIKSVVEVIPAPKAEKPAKPEVKEPEPEVNQEQGSKPQAENN